MIPEPKLCPQHQSLGEKKMTRQKSVQVHRKIYLVKLLKKNSFKKSRLKYKLKENISFQSV